MLSAISKIMLHTFSHYVFFLATAILSTKLGYFLPAFLALTLAEAIWFFDRGVDFFNDFGLFFFQIGAFFLDLFIAITLSIFFT